MKTYFKFILLMSSMMMLSQTSCDKYGKLFKDYQSYINGKAVDSLCLDNKLNRLEVTPLTISIESEKNRSKKYKSDGSIWGVSRGDEFFRFVEKSSFFDYGKFIKVIYKSDGFVLYSICEMDTYGLNLNIEYFYSLGINNTVKKLKVKNIEEDFPNPIFLVEAKKLYNLYDQDMNGKYLLAKLYEENYINQK